MTPTTRREALEKNQKHYFTGKPCKHGHVSLRRVSGTCLECEREEKRAAYKADPQKFKDRALAAYRKDPSKTKRRNAEWVQQNRERARAARRDWEARNRCKVRARQVEALKDQSNREKARASARRHYERNKPEYMALSAKRRAVKRRAIPAWFGEFDAFAWSEAMRLTKMRAKFTGITWDADHIIPLVSDEVCGLHLACNLQVIPARLNKIKSNKLIFTNRGDWISHI